MRHLFLCLVFMLIIGGLQAQSLGELTVEKIMRDPKWIGSAPLASTGRPTVKLFTSTGIQTKPLQTLYIRSRSKIVPRKKYQKKKGFRIHLHSVYTIDRSPGCCMKKTVIYSCLISLREKSRKLPTPWVAKAELHFQGDEKKIIYSVDQNLYAWEISTG
jgi:hypothetical protein